MLKEVQLKNFRCFNNHKLSLNDITIAVGKNNAGKSTLVEALCVISLVSSKYQNLPYRDPPSDLDIPLSHKGISPSIKNMDFNLYNIFYRYGESPSEISATFTDGCKISVFVGDN